MTKTEPRGECSHAPATATPVAVIFRTKDKAELLIPPGLAQEPRRDGRANPAVGLAVNAKLHERAHDLPANPLFTAISPDGEQLIPTVDFVRKDGRPVEFDDFRQLRIPAREAITKHGIEAIIHKWKCQQ